MDFETKVQLLLGRQLHTIVRLETLLEEEQRKSHKLVQLCKGLEAEVAALRPKEPEAPAEVSDANPVPLDTEVPVLN